MRKPRGTGSVQCGASVALMKTWDADRSSVYRAPIAYMWRRQWSIGKCYRKARSLTSVICAVSRNSAEKLEQHLQKIWYPDLYLEMSAAKGISSLTLC